jgi:DNA-directed RNA polymerase I, II, and III subunit RPABC1
MTTLAHRTVTQDDRVRLTNVLRTLRQMLAQRGYNIDEFEWPSAEDVNTLADYERLNMVFYHSQARPPLMVFYVGELSAGKQSVMDLERRMSEETIGHAIVILRGKLTPQGSEQLNELTRVRTESERRTVQRKRVEKFYEAELQVDITEHELVPRHTALNNDEKKRIMKQYYCGEDEQFPALLLNDPITRYYGWTRGQMVRIERPSETAGTTVFYRIVT